MEIKTREYKLLKASCPCRRRRRLSNDQRTVSLPCVATFLPPIMGSYHRPVRLGESCWAGAAGPIRRLNISSESSPSRVNRTGSMFPSAAATASSRFLAGRRDTHRSLAAGSPTSGKHITWRLHRLLVPLHPPSGDESIRRIRAMVDTEHVRDPEPDRVRRRKAAGSPYALPQPPDRVTDSLEPPDPATAGPSKSTRSMYTRRYMADTSSIDLNAHVG